MSKTIHPVRFCSRCGAAVTHEVPEGDNRIRAICGGCGYVHYVNPNVVVGIVGIWENRWLLCRRAIEPRRGYWTIPAGYMELYESAEEGALREAWEEAQAQIDIRSLLAVYSLPHISQVQILFLGNLMVPDVLAGVESLEVALFEWGKIPWNDLAFPSVHRALNHARKMLEEPQIGPDRSTGDMTIPS